MRECVSVRAREKERIRVERETENVRGAECRHDLDAPVPWLVAVVGVVPARRPTASQVVRIFLNTIICIECVYTRIRVCVCVRVTPCEGL